MTGVERESSIDVDVVRGFIKSVGAPLREVILDQMVAAVHPMSADAPTMPTGELASVDQLAAKLRDAMGLGARQKSSWA